MLWVAPLTRLNPEITPSSLSPVLAGMGTTVSLTGESRECRTYFSNRLISALSAPRDSLTGRKMPCDGSCQPCQRRDELTACAFWRLYSTNRWHFQKPIFFTPPSWKCTAQLSAIFLFSCMISVSARPRAKFTLWCRQQTKTFKSLLQTSKRPSEKTEAQKCEIETATGLSGVVN